MLSPGPAGAEAQEWTTLGRTLIGIRRGAGEVRRKVVAVIAVAIREARSGARIRLVGDPPARDRVPVLTVVGIEPVARELGDARGVAHCLGAPRDVERSIGRAVGTGAQLGAHLRPPPARARKDLHDARHSVGAIERSEEHTSELQSLAYLVCRL